MGIAFVVEFDVSTTIGSFVSFRGETVSSDIRDEMFMTELPTPDTTRYITCRLHRMTFHRVNMCARLNIFLSACTS